MLKELILQAEKKAGGQEKAGELLGIQRTRLADFKKLKREPNEEFILKLADYLGLDKGKTLYDVKLEISPDSAYLWKWCARRESNPRPSASEAFTNLVQYILTLSLVSSLVGQPYRHHLDHEAV